MASCAVCGRELPPVGRGRPQRYCSRACRARAYRERVAEKQREPDIEDTEQALSAERIVAAAIALADRDGGAGLSMRRTAAELGVGAMSLYRYVPGKEELGGLMIDEVFGRRPLPEPGPDGWRAKLELSARQEWALYTEHPWLPQMFAMITRPPIAPRMMAYTDWRIRAVDGIGLDFTTLARIAIMLSTHTQSAALQLARETHEAAPREQWMSAQGEKIKPALAALPMIARFGRDEFEASEPESVFEFGLQRLLDGVEVLVSR